MNNFETIFHKPHAENSLELQTLEQNAELTKQFIKKKIGSNN